MIEDLIHEFDLSKPRRKYFSEDCGLTSCPECGSQLTKHNCTVIISVKSDTDAGEFMSNHTNSHFCNSCRVVVFDSDKIETAARLGIKGDKNLKYEIGGIVDFNAIPEKKRHLEMGIKGNPMPLVRFLPALNKAAVVSEKKTGRNEKCPCGSGKKYKKCCG